MLKDIYFQSRELIGTTNQSTMLPLEVCVIFKYASFFMSLNYYYEKPVEYDD